MFTVAAAAGARADAAGVRAPLRAGHNIVLQYAVMNAGTLSSSFSLAIPTSINNQGQIVGGGQQCRFAQFGHGVNNDSCGPPSRWKPSQKGGANPNISVAGNCLYSDGSTIIDFTPIGVSSCGPQWINEFGTVVGDAGIVDGIQRGQVQHDAPAGGAFVYQAPTGTFTSYNNARLFNQVNNLSVAAGGFLPGLTYNIVTETFGNIFNPQDGCEMEQAFSINDVNDVLGEDFCAESLRYEIVHKGQWRYLKPPGSLYIPATTTKLNIHDDVMLVSGYSGGHTYLWKGAQGMPLDLGTLPGHSADGYEPLAFNDARSVLGVDYTSNIYWVWDPIHGMRALGPLLQTNPYSAIVPAAINANGDLAASALDPFDNIVWLILVHPHV